MNLTEIFNQSKEPLKLILVNLSNKVFEQALQYMVFKDTGVKLTFNITTELGFPNIMVFVPEWANKTLSNKELLALDDHAYSFDFPDEDFSYLLERLFCTEDQDIYIDAKRSDVTETDNFIIDVYIQLDHYGKLLTELGV